MSDDCRYYYYHFGLTVASLSNEISSEMSEYNALIESHIRDYLRNVMKLTCPFSVKVDYFESDKKNVASPFSGDTTELWSREFVINCRVSIDIRDNNRIKITNPSQYNYMRDNESRYLKKFIHVI